MSEREESGGGGGGGFGGFLLGVAIGAVVGFLFAPGTGEDTRRKLSQRLKTLRDAAEDKVDEVRGLLEAEEDDAEEEPGTTREQLQRRLQAAGRRRRAGREEDVEEGDEPVA